MEILSVPDEEKGFFQAKGSTAEDTGVSDTTAGSTRPEAAPQTDTAENRAEKIQGEKRRTQLTIEAMRKLGRHGIAIKTFRRK